MNKDYLLLKLEEIRKAALEYKSLKSDIRDYGHLRGYDVSARANNIHCDLVELIDDLIREIV